MGIQMRPLLNSANAIVAAALVILAAPANAAIPLGDSPLFLTVSVPPNITLTLDDSGSMARGYVPDLCGPVGYDCAKLDNRYVKSAHFNPIYYNPHVRYAPPKNANGAELTTTFNSAYRNGFDTTFGTVDLRNRYRPTALLDLPPGSTNSRQDQYMGHFEADVRCETSVCQIRDGKGGWVSGQSCPSTSSIDARRLASCVGGENNNSWDYDPAGLPAYYYVFDPTNNDCTNVTADRAEDNDCYDIVIVSETSGPATTDINDDGFINAADADERQNFANWYSFARTRNFATQTAASLAFVNLDPSVRVSWQALNTCRGDASTLVTNDCDGWRNTSGVSNAIRPFEGLHKTNFFNWVFRLPTDASTPLPAAMRRVGEYYKTSGENSPYDNNFSTNNSGELTCRRNYHVMMTDGIWNNAVSVGNEDGTNKSLPETVNGVSTYSRRNPFLDDYGNTLADVAFRYWSTDLRNNFGNALLPLYRDSTGSAVQNFWNPRNDPATWQHMVNFTIGLGLSGYLSQSGLSWDGNMYGGSYPAIAAGTTAWPEPGNDRVANVADLWHAAINSRGQFFSADDPASLSVAFRAALTAITESSGSSAALSANSTSLSGSTLVYQAKFNQDWSGTLVALPIGAGGAIGAPAWDASTLIPTPYTARRIFTYDGTSGLEFSSCATLNPQQRAALNMSSGGAVDNRCEERLAWLRGDASGELRNGGPFRNRPETVMGDIINSDPAYVKDLDYGYSNLPGYDAYRAENAGRMPMIYVGSNDGRMYGIRGDAGAADSGVEKFSYIPEGVFSNLRHLTDPSYAHRYYVDGSITASDAFIGGQWRTVVLGGLNAGGKSIYALDVTDPAAFDASNVLWEFGQSNDTRDLGFTFSRPQVGVLENGQWVAIFGNGYNSTDGGAHLFVVNLESGDLIRKITASDIAGDENNGLSTPILVDADDNGFIDSVYAGDLQGNLWKFNVSAGSSGSWQVAYGQPLFRARRSGVGQPITAQPKVVDHPVGGQLILFGTGRYLTNSDITDSSVQTYYGIRDSGSAITTTDRSQLQRQSFDAQTGAFGRAVRSVTENSVDWGGGMRGWYLDLVNGTGNGSANGERVIHSSVIANGRVIFATVVPSTDPCQPGGSSWLLALKLGTGGGFTHSIFDLNNDGFFTDADKATDHVVSGMRLDGLGISNVPVYIEEEGGAGPDVGHLFSSGTSDGTEQNEICTFENEALCASTSFKRRSWIQIR